MNKLVVVLMLIGFVYAAFVNIRFWSEALREREVELLWWLPWILLPTWLILFAIGLSIIWTELV